MSLTPLVLDERKQRLGAALVTILLCIHSHFLCYYALQEYHYTTLLPTLPVMLWLWQREGRTWHRRLLMTAFVVSLLVFAPTPYYPAKEDPQRLANINLVERVVPVAVSFCCLTLYGVASAWRGRRRPKLITGPMRNRHWPTARLGAMLAVLLGSVLAVAYGTVPSRLRSRPSQWSDRDFAEYYDTMIAQLARTVKAAPNSANARYKLGVALKRRGRLQQATAEFQRAVEIDPDDSSSRSSLGAALAAMGRFQEAVVQLPKVLESEPKNTAARLSLADTLATSGRVDEAIAQYQKVLEIESPVLSTATPVWRSPCSVVAGTPTRRHIFVTPWSFSPTMWSAEPTGPGFGPLVPSPPSATAWRRSSMPNTRTNSARGNGRTSCIPWPWPMPRRGNSPRPWAPRNKLWRWPVHR